VSGRPDVGSPEFGWPEADIADDAAGVVLLVATGSRTTGFRAAHCTTSTVSLREANN